MSVYRQVFTIAMAGLLTGLFVCACGNDRPAESDVTVAEEVLRRINARGAAYAERVCECQHTDEDGEVDEEARDKCVDMQFRERTLGECARSAVACHPKAYQTLGACRVAYFRAVTEECLARCPTDDEGRNEAGKCRQTKQQRLSNCLEAVPEDFETDLERCEPGGEALENCAS